MKGCIVIEEIYNRILKKVRIRPCLDLFERYDCREDNKRGMH